MFDLYVRPGFEALYNIQPNHMFFLLSLLRLSAPPGRWKQLDKRAYPTRGNN